jgi:tryptophanyl-tRNA synthetase
MTKRILSGMQPTNQLHLGNYLGALRNWVKLQDQGDFETLFCVVDLHAITVQHDVERLKNSTREIAAAYIAAGVDPEKSILFAQSSVPAHSQLMWLLATMTQMGKLSRMTQFKDKAGKNKEKAGLGLYAYPVLMAADILIYKATHVPVGDDQRQHLELAREIVGTFNHRYGENYFPEPESVVLAEGARIMSLRDGAEKMSKSAQSDMTRINLTDDADLIAKKIRKAKTDAEVLPEKFADLELRLEAKNLVTIYGALTDKSGDEVLAEFAGKTFSDFKPALVDVAVSHLSPISTRMNELLSDTDQIDAYLHRGAERANAIARPHIDEVMDLMGFWR